MKFITNHTTSRLQRLLLQFPVGARTLCFLQQANHLLVTVTRRQHQRRVAGEIQPENIGAAGDQQLDDGRVPLLRGQMQRPSAAILEIMLLETRTGKGAQTKRKQHTDLKNVLHIRESGNDL
jgi:hypothetical protein